MVNHKYSTYMLIAILFIFVTAIIGSALTSDDFDVLCSTNNAVLKRIGGTWACSNTNFAQGYYHNSTNPITITLNNVNIYYNITGFTIDKAYGITINGNSVEINKEGYYKIDSSVSFTGGNTGNYEFEMFINGNEEEQCGFHRATSNNAIGVGTFTCIVYLYENDLLQVKVEDVSAPSQDINIYSMNFNIVEIQ